MFTGIQILEPRIFDYIPRGVFSHSTTDVYPQAIASGERLVGHVASGKWRELSTLQRYRDISLEMLRERNLLLTAGVDTLIAASASVVDSVLWDNVTVDDGAQVTRSVLADDVHIERNESLANAVVVQRSLVEGKAPPAKSLNGYFQKENFVVQLGG